MSRGIPRLISHILRISLILAEERSLNAVDLSIVTALIRARARVSTHPFAATVRVLDERVDSVEVADIVREAAAARNGWKVILGRCAPKPRSKATSSGVLTTA